MTGSGEQTAVVRGWCPGAHRPMMSGDGLVVRVRPKLARLTTDQAVGLCAVAGDFGNGTIDLTNRANLQIRGVAPDAHEMVLQRLAALDLLDADADIETRRNVLVSPFWTSGDRTERLTLELLERLAEMQPVERAAYADRLLTVLERRGGQDRKNQQRDNDD